ncbi:DUF4345 domain-containing protein [Williamsia sterculiae]|uniref:DUF4345 domain-containing protein n=1 Tax=Williamsia sterculiae TaxID=1344003 RepID=A0A1N7H6Q3_9NOCA|nr:DUF4345 domain-containing protein [Williamsia sterculiae]SIS20390.1 protein of unknown function [Williamsia sterculiae]
MRVFMIWLRVFGVVVIGIALAHLLFGQTTYIGGGRVNATMESDLRFFNVLFAAYGIAFVWAAGDVIGRARIIDILGVLFFVGGLARLLAWVVAGAPSWFYVVMIPVELIIPVVHLLVLRRIERGIVGVATP